MPKYITTLTNEQIKLFEAEAEYFTDGNGIEYYHLPHFYKKLGYNEFELIKREDLPEWLKEFFTPEIT